MLQETGGQEESMADHLTEFLVAGDKGCIT